MLRQGDLDGAISHFRTVTVWRPMRRCLTRNWDRLWRPRVSLDEAASELSEAVKLAPQQPEVHRQLARVLSSQGKIGDAIAEMKQAVTLAPDQPELHDDLGVLLAQKSQFAEAEKEFRDALALDSHYEPALFHLGVDIVAIGRHRWRHTAAHPGDPRPIRRTELRSTTWEPLWKQSTILRARFKPINRRRSLRPIWFLCKPGWACCLQRSGDPENAAVAFRKVVELTPNDPEAYNNLGLALMQHGEGPAAVKEFQHALKLRPDDAAFRGNLAVTLLQQSDFDAAAEQLQEALKTGSRRMRRCITIWRWR